MYEPEFDTAPTPQRPRTATVLGLLAVTATVLSYLFSYAMANALVAAEVVVQVGGDPGVVALSLIS